MVRNKFGMMVIHKFEILGKVNVCGIGEEGNSSVNYLDVTCLECLEIDRKEWTRQIEFFKGQPRINAVNGLKRVEERIKCIVHKNKKIRGEEK